MERERAVRFELNGESLERRLPVNESLLNVLRYELGATEVKNGCEKGDCGACVVLVDGQAENTCCMLAVQADGCDVTTIEGLAQDGELHPMQDAFRENHALQCGFCTPGMVLSVRQLLKENPRPSQHDIRRGIAGNLCRCTGYASIVRAVLDLTDE